MPCFDRALLEERFLEDWRIVVRKSMGSDGFESGCEIFLFVVEVN